MRRISLYLDDELWNTLRTCARIEGTTVSDLVRQAARERYLSKRGERLKAMQALVRIRKDRADMPDSVEYVRSLRRRCRPGKQ
jgi:hypothetical protein